MSELPAGYDNWRTHGDYDEQTGTYESDRTVMSIPKATPAPAPKENYPEYVIYLPGGLGAKPVLLRHTSDRQGTYVEAATGASLNVMREMLEKLEPTPDPIPTPPTATEQEVINGMRYEAWDTGAKFGAREAPVLGYLSPVFLHRNNPYRRAAPADKF